MSSAGQKIKLVLTYPMTTGRNFDEIRAPSINAADCQAPGGDTANWKQGEDVIITAAVSNETRSSGSAPTRRSRRIWEDQAALLRE
jgi:alkyl hydroperoxide reductase subunit AhpC